jgi:hypothetical protein
MPTQKDKQSQIGRKVNFAEILKMRIECDHLRSAIGKARISCNNDSSSFFPSSPAALLAREAGAREGATSSAGQNGGIIMRRFDAGTRRGFHSGRVPEVTTKEITGTSAVPLQSLTTCWSA